MINIQQVKQDYDNGILISKATWGKVIEMAMEAAPVPEAKAEQVGEPDAADEWRRLALQFDGHRMQALWHLKAMLEDATKHAPIAAEFLTAGPLSGEEVLAQRIAAMTAPVVKHEASAATQQARYSELAGVAELVTLADKLNDHWGECAWLDASELLALGKAIEIATQLHNAAPISEDSGKHEASELPPKFDPRKAINAHVVACVDIWLKEVGGPTYSDLLRAQAARAACAGSLPEVPPQFADHRWALVKISHCTFECGGDMPPLRNLEMLGVSVPVWTMDRWECVSAAARQAPSITVPAGSIGDDAEFLRLLRGYGEARTQIFSENVIPRMKQLVAYIDSRSHVAAPDTSARDATIHALLKAFVTLESHGGRDRSIVLRFDDREDAYIVHDFIISLATAASSSDKEPLA